VAPGGRPAPLPSFGEGLVQTGTAAGYGVRLIQENRSALGAVLDSAQAQDAPLTYRGDPLTRETAGQIFDRYPQLSSNDPAHIAIAFRVRVLVIDHDGNPHTYGMRDQQLVVIGQNRDGWYLASTPTPTPTPSHRYSGGSHGYGGGYGGPSAPGGGYGPPPGGSGSSGGYTTRAARADASDSMITGLRKAITERKTRLQERGQDPDHDVTLTRLREQLHTHLPTPATTDSSPTDQPATHNRKPTPRIDHDPDGTTWATPHRSAYTPTGKLIPTDQRACVSITILGPPVGV
jgi:hypothetical protein